MQSFYYQPGKNALLALGMGALAALCGWSWWGSGSWFALGGLLAFGVAFAKAVHNALNGEPALRLGPDSLTVRTTFGSEEVRWRDVQNISLETIRYRYYGVIPMGGVDILCIAANGGLSGTRRLRVATSTIDLPPGGAKGLLQLVHAAHIAAVGQAGAAMAGAGPRGWGVDPAGSSADKVPASDFDPDAAIARYLAAKNATAETNRAAAPVRATGLPQRPTFGRRTA